MEAVYLHNRGRSVGSAAAEALGSASRVAIAAAYSSPDGVGQLEDGLAHLGERGGSARLLTGLDDFITDLRGVHRFAELPGAECRVPADGGR